jgi:hypothetical protein
MPPVNAAAERGSQPSRAQSSVGPNPPAAGLKPSPGVPPQISHSSHPPPPSFTTGEALGPHSLPEAEQISFQTGEDRRGKMESGESQTRESHPSGYPQGPSVRSLAHLSPPPPTAELHRTEASRTPATGTHWAPSRSSSSEGPEKKGGPFPPHLGRRRSLMAAGGGERRGAAPRGERTDGVVCRRPPRPPPRALALAAARVEDAGGEYPSVGPVPPLLPASPRPPMSHRRGTALLRLRTGAMPAAPISSPAPRKRRPRREG